MVWDYGKLEIDAVQKLLKELQVPAVTAVSCFSRSLRLCKGLLDIATPSLISTVAADPVPSPERPPIGWLGTYPTIGPSSHEFPQVFRQEVMKALPGYYVFFDEGALHVPGPVNGGGCTAG